MREASAQPAAPRTDPATEHHALCVQLFERNRTCSDVYIPALVDARARNDAPAGIAAQVAADRDGVIAQARAEWANDSTDAAIDATCTAIVEHLSQADLDDVGTARSCLAQTECTAYTTCSMPIFEKHFTK